MNPPLLTFDYAGFIAQCPAYSDAGTYPESLLQAYWDGATNYVSNIGNFGAIQGTSRQFALNLMTAHLVFYAGLVASQQVPALMQTATIDKVSIGVTPPPLPNQWQWFLNILSIRAAAFSSITSEFGSRFLYFGTLTEEYKDIIPIMVLGLVEHYENKTCSIFPKVKRL